VNLLPCPRINYDDIGRAVVKATRQLVAYETITRISPGAIYYRRDFGGETFRKFLTRSEDQLNRSVFGFSPFLFDRPHAVEFDLYSLSFTTVNLPFSFIFLNFVTKKDSSDKNIAANNFRTIPMLDRRLSKTKHLTTTRTFLVSTSFVLSTNMRRPSMTKQTTRTKRSVFYENSTMVEHDFFYRRVT